MAGGTTAVAPPVATTTATLTASTTTTAASATAGFSLVDAQGTPHQFSALEAIDGPGLHVVIGHLHKSETTLAASVPLQGEGAVHDIAETGEKFNNVLLLSAEGQIAYKDAHERGWGNRYGCRITRRVSDPRRLVGLRNNA